MVPAESRPEKLTVPAESRFEKLTVSRNSRLKKQKTKEVEKMAVEKSVFNNNDQINSFLRKIMVLKIMKYLGLTKEVQIAIKS